MEVPQLNEDMLAHLQEQDRFLYRSADAFDDGDESEARRLAVTIRVLVHDTAHSKSLLEQFGLKRYPFADSAGPLRPGNLMTESPLTIMESGPEGARFRPQFVNPPQSPIGQPFARWWSTPVVKDRAGSKFSRADLVLGVADQDGGAHVDHAFDDRYSRLTRSNSLDWVRHTELDGDQPIGSPVLPSVRRIAEEVLITLQRYAIAAIPEERRLPRAERRRY